MELAFEFKHQRHRQSSQFNYLFIDKSTAEMVTTTTTNNLWSLDQLNSHPVAESSENRSSSYVYGLAGVGQRRMSWRLQKVDE